MLNENLRQIDAARKSRSEAKGMKRLEYGNAPQSKTKFRCAGCRWEFDGAGSIYCPVCKAKADDHEHAVKGGLRFGRFVFREGSVAIPLDVPLALDGHFFWIDTMARSQHGRAMLAPSLLRWYEARATRETTR
jgi:hypothetical protein